MACYLKKKESNNVELLRFFVQACHVGTFIMMICRTYKYMLFS